MDIFEYFEQHMKHPSHFSLSSLFKLDNYWKLSDKHDDVSKGFVLSPLKLMKPAKWPSTKQTISISVTPAFIFIFCDLPLPLNLDPPSGTQKISVCCTARRTQPRPWRASCWLPSHFLFQRKVCRRPCSGWRKPVPLEEQPPCRAFGTSATGTSLRSCGPLDRTAG